MKINSLNFGFKREAQKTLLCNKVPQKGYIAQKKKSTTYLGCYILGILVYKF